MKSIKMRNYRLETALCRLGAVFVLITLFINNIDAIRVYEGTNFPDPGHKIQKTLGLTKKSLYITKRSWSGGDDSLKGPGKIDRLGGKWKDFNKRTMEDDTPTLYKIKFTDKTFKQYIRYIKEVPRLEEYTLCMWYKPTNLSHDQTLFFYSITKNEVLLRLWINSIDSTLRMAIRENVVYKVPANIREHKWHHICQSWNGVLGEIQMFLDGKRIGAGVLSHYKGTYIPEGGVVTLGQDVVGLGKRFYDGMEGEMFGFNLVDEAVPHDQGSFINSQYRPSIQSSVPPFKKLPPIKKTYQEIKAFISTLPGESTEIRKKNEALSSEEPNIIKKSKESYAGPPKRTRGNQRIRYPPLRKVVVYNREDRQLPLEQGLLELNKTVPLERVKSLESDKNQTFIKPSQSYDENYSIHSYRFGKQEKKNTNYEIYESIDDDSVRPAVEDEQTVDDSLERKARQNFNLFTAREANKVYTLSSSVKDLKKPKFHFETRIQKTAQPEVVSRRSFIVEEPIARAPAKPKEEKEDRTLSDSIPVYEIEVVESRKKRSTEEGRKSRQFTPEDPLVDANGFRRLPQIPDSFINLFTQNASKTEIEEKLQEFFPKVESTEEESGVEMTEIPKSYIPETDAIIVPQEATVQQIIRQPPEDKKAVPEIPETTVIPAFSPIPPLGEAFEKKQMEYAGVLNNPKPINFPTIREPFKDFNPGRPKEKMSQVEGKTQPTVERRFDVSSGTDLVMRSYGECTAERGSPIYDKLHLVISWADTPVRIFGGAQVEGAKNECGHF